MLASGLFPALPRLTNCPQCRIFPSGASLVGVNKNIYLSMLQTAKISSEQCPTSKRRPGEENHRVIRICANHSLNWKPQGETQQSKELHHKVLEECKTVPARHTLQTGRMQLLKDCVRQLCAPMYTPATTPMSLSRYGTQSRKQAAESPHHFSPQPHGLCPFRAGMGFRTSFKPHVQHAPINY